MPCELAQYGDCEGDLDHLYDRGLLRPGRSGLPLELHLRVQDCRAHCSVQSLVHVEGQCLFH